MKIGARTVQVEADAAMADALLAELTAALDRPGATPVRGRLLGSAGRLVLELDDPTAFAAFEDAAAVRALAESLAARGLVVDLVAGGRHLASLGAVSASWWQRRVTGTRCIRVRDLRAAWRPAPRAGQVALDAAPVAPVVPLSPRPEPPELGLVS